jgi:hypothetical protein
MPGVDWIPNIEGNKNEVVIMQIKVNNITDIIKGDDRKSFHVFSEKYLRGEIKRFNKGEILNKYKIINNNLFIIVINGKFEIIIDEYIYIAESNFQILLAEGEEFSINILEDTILEFIWSPGLY